MSTLFNVLAGVLLQVELPDPIIMQRILIPLVCVFSVFAVLFIILYIVMAIRVRLLNPLTGHEGLIGEPGRVTHDLDPDGSVIVLGERWAARAEDKATILRDTEIEVVDVQRMRLIVRPREE